MKPLKIEIFPQPSGTLALLTATLFIILSMNFSSVFADDDYTFRDENNDAISLPSIPPHSLLHPGAMAQKAASHNPQISVKSRRDGLEDVRILDFHFPQLPDPSEKDFLNGIYVLDKDGLVIGYKALRTDQQDARIIINSVINYVQIYVKCSNHGLWKKELAIRL